MSENENKGPYRVSFAAIDPFIEKAIPSGAERVLTGKNRVEWGDGNAYPDYLLTLSEETPSLRSIIAGTVDYICGNEVQLIGPSPLPENVEDGLLGRLDVMNRKGETISAQYRKLALDLVVYGGFALQVIRSASGKVAETNYIDLRFLRSNKDNTVFYYSEKWGKGGRGDVIVYPKYIPISERHWIRLSDDEKNANVSSIFFFKIDDRHTYPLPLYNAAIKACETERSISDYHLNSLANGFSSSVIVNFNNGTPSEKIQEEIENNVNEKFAGYQNAGRPLVAFNTDRAHAVSVDKISTDDFGERYAALEKTSRQQIFSSFRANPNLFGIATESTGFNSEEYESAFRLFNRTVVKPLQGAIVSAFEYIFQQVGYITVQPFSLGGDTNKNV